MNTVLFENIIIYGVFAIIFAVIVFYYVRQRKKTTKIVEDKIETAKELGLFEPISLHPEVDANSCIQTGACVAACPEKDILGIRNGKATTINASRCVGHGACVRACPVQAIVLKIGTETRGVELPEVSPEFESNVPGLFIAGELGGMGLIRNAVKQGQQAVENIYKKNKNGSGGDYDLIIIGAGPAGIAASLTAKKFGMKFLTLDQDTLGGTIYSFPREKIIMTSTMELPLYGKIKGRKFTKDEILGIFGNALNKNGIEISENTKVDAVLKEENSFIVKTAKGEYSSSFVLLAIGRRGTPRKLGVGGEELPKVFYKLLDPQRITDKNILVVGGGDSAVEAALILADYNNNVTVSYRKDKFGRIKEKNYEKIKKAEEDGKVKVIYNSQVKRIENDKVILTRNNDEEFAVPNDLVYVFIGGELPKEFLKKAGINIETKYGETIQVR